MSILNYQYYDQTKSFRFLKDDGKTDIVKGTSSIITDIVDSIAENIITPHKKILIDLLVCGYANKNGISSSNIVLSVDEYLSDVKAYFSGTDVSNDMLYLNSTSTCPYGKSVIQEAHKHLYKQESVSNFYENKIIKEIGSNQKYLLGVSQSIATVVDSEIENNPLKELNGIVTVSTDESNSSPRAGVFQQQSVKELVESTQYKKEDVYPSWSKLRTIRNEVIELFHKFGLEAEPRIVLTDEIFKIAEGLQMLQNGEEQIFTVDEIRNAVL